MLTFFAELRRRGRAIVRAQVRIGHLRQLLQDATSAVVRAARVIIRHVHAVVIFDDAFHGIVADFRVRRALGEARAVGRQKFSENRRWLGKINGGFLG